MTRTTRIGALALLLLIAGCGDSDSDKRSASEPAGGGGRAESPDVPGRAAYEAWRKEAERASERRQAEKLAWEKERERHKKVLEERLADDLTGDQVAAHIAKARAEVDRQRQEVARRDAAYDERRRQGGGFTNERHARDLARSKLRWLEEELRGYEEKLGSIKAEQREVERLAVKQEVQRKQQRGFAYMLAHKWAHARAAFLSVKQVPGVRENDVRRADALASKLDRLIELRGKPDSVGAFAAKDQIIRRAADQVAEIKSGLFDIMIERAKALRQAEGRTLGQAWKMETEIARSFLDRDNQRALMYGELQLWCMSLTVEVTRTVGGQQVARARNEIAKLERERDAAVAEARRKQAFDRVGAATESRITPTDMEIVRQALQSGNERERGDAVRAVKGMGAGAKVFLPELVRLSGPAQSKPIRLDAMEALGAIGPEAKEGVDALLAAAADPNSTVRKKAADTLGAFGPAAKGILPSVVDSFLNNNPSGSSLRAAIAKIDPEGSICGPILLRAVSGHTDPEARAQGLYALRSLCKRPKDVIPTLAGMLETEKDARALAAAAYALGGMGRQLGAEGKVVVAPLIKVLKHPDSSVRSRAVNALDGLDRAAVRDNPALVAALNESLQDKDRSIAAAARRVLRKLER